MFSAERPGSSDDFASFLLGGVILALYPRDLLRAEAAADLAPTPAGAWNGITLALNVDDRDDVDAVFTEAVPAGARGVSPPQDRDWGGRSGYVADPEGQSLGDRLGAVDSPQRRGRRG
jgi:catechol 2,3-dioxygenase-like lactoylglutathione lyase family enzyme